jgi:hypothetical protein
MPTVVVSRAAYAFENPVGITSQMMPGAGGNVTETLWADLARKAQPNDEDRERTRRECRARKTAETDQGGDATSDAVDANRN